MSRKFLPFLVAAILCAAGLFAWKSLKTTATPTPATSVQVPVRTTLHSTPQPTRLDFLTDTGQPYQVRITLFRNTLATECSEPELRLLYRLLEQGPSRGELTEHWYVIANDIMNRIRRYETDPQRFSSKFIALLNSSKQADVIRDYAVQHLASWLKPRSAQGNGASIESPSPEIASRVLDALAAATIDPALEQSSIPGTTLMMLVDLTRSGSMVDCKQAIATLEPWLTRALKDGSTLSNPIRVSAVSAAGILAPAEFRPIIRKIAYQENGDSALRLPALAALGKLGDAEDLPKLREIAANSPALSYAARDAGRTIAENLTR